MSITLNDEPDKRTIEEALSPEDVARLVVLKAALSKGD